MENEFNLSNKRIQMPNGYKEDKAVFEVIYSEEDVKKAIKELMDRMGNTTRGLCNKDLQKFYTEVKEIFGEKLT